MNLDPFSTGSVDYFQRTGFEPDWARLTRTGVPLAARRLARVTAVGQVGRGAAAFRDGSPHLPPTVPLLVGLAEAGIPVAYRLRGDASGLSVAIGTWSNSIRGADDLDARQRIVLTTLDGAYSVVDLAASGVASAQLGSGALVLGVPQSTPPDAGDGAVAIDRLIRSLSGRDWSALILATPVDASILTDDRNSILNEMRAVVSEAQGVGARSPLAEYYESLLEGRLHALADAVGLGGWRTTVYLQGGAIDDRLALVSAWRAVFAGTRSELESAPLESLRTITHPSIPELAEDWSVLDGIGAPGPTGYHHPFAAQSLLTSAQLAAYLHLPTLETAGFRRRVVTRFDTEPPQVSDDRTIRLGDVLSQRGLATAPYPVALDSLTRHAFVCGTTGSGKTNTIFALLSETVAAGIPFLVVEPAKAEYRSLMTHPTIGGSMRVFTAGKATVSPLTLNPFEVLEGTAVSEHLDLLRAAFAAGFGMWTPLPQILERCLHEVYEDCGWDLRTDSNLRLTEGEVEAAAFPTLSDLVRKVRAVIPTLGYESRIAGDLGAALVTRLQALRSGGKGAMFDVRLSTPMSVLLDAPTVIELEALGDDGDRAFLTALLLIRLAEYRRGLGQADSLRHLLVVEEAHRVFAAPAVAMTPDFADPGSQAVETLSNLLSEIRAYGQGVIVADQVPVRIAADVMKNTTLKIAHRTVSLDDRRALGGAMAMAEEQLGALTTLGVGEAVVFGSGDDSPMLVRVPLAKGAVSGALPTDEQVVEHMRRWRKDAGLPEFDLPDRFCATTCAGAPEACRAGRNIVSDHYVQRVFARLVLATIEESGAVDREWGGWVDTVSSRVPAGIDRDAVLRSLAGHGAEWYAQRRGAQGRWQYSATAELADRLRAVLLDKLDGSPSQARQSFRAALSETAFSVHARSFDPYPACGSVCTQSPRVCLYRSAVADVIETERFHLAWREADVSDSRSADSGADHTWEVCQDAAYEVVEFPEEGLADELRNAVTTTAKRACLCFEQQMLALDASRSPRAVERTIARVVARSGL